MRNIEKHRIFLKKTEGRNRNSIGGFKRYYVKENKISSQGKVFHEKNKEKLLQKQNDRYIHFKEIVRTYVQLQNRMKALDEKISKNDSENIQNIYHETNFQTTQKDLCNQ